MKKKSRNLNFLKAGITVIVILAFIMPAPSVVSKDTPGDIYELEKPLLTYSQYEYIEISGGLNADVEAFAAVNWSADHDNGALDPQAFQLSTTGGSGVSWLQGISAHAYSEWYDDQDEDWFNTAEADVGGAMSEVSAFATSNSLGGSGSVIAPLNTLCEDGEPESRDKGGIDFTTSHAEASLITSPYTITIPFKVSDYCKMYGSINLAMLGGAPPDIDYVTYSKVSLTIYKGNNVVECCFIELDDIGGNADVFSGFISPGPDYLLEATFYADHFTSSSAGCDNQGPNGGPVIFEDIFSINVHFTALPDEDTSHVEP